MRNFESNWGFLLRNSIEANTQNLGKDNLDMFYKNYCWAVICYPICVTNVSYERELIVLSFPIISCFFPYFLFFWLTLYRTPISIWGHNMFGPGPLILTRQRRIENIENWWAVYSTKFDQLQISLYILLNLDLKLQCTFVGVFVKDVVREGEKRKMVINHA